HSRSHAQGAMNLDEIVREIGERNSSGMILQLARESIAQARVTPAVSSQCPVLALDITGAHVFRVRIAAHNFHITADAAGRRITSCPFIRWCTVDFLQLTVIDLRPKRFQVRAVSVAGDLYALAEARC